MTSTVTENHTKLQTLTQLATQTEVQTKTETSVVEETALAQCLGKCQSQWGLSAGNGNKYNTYASPSPSWTTTAAGSYYTQSPPAYTNMAASSGSYMYGSASAQATGCNGCSD